MAPISPRSPSHSHCRTRSVSFPSRSHPSTIKIEQVLNKIKTWEASFSSPKSVEKITHNALSGLVELYKCIDEILVLPMTRRALLQHEDNDFLKDLLENSVKFLDICSNMRDTIMLMKTSIRELQSALRRRKTGNDHLRIQSNVMNYFSCRRNTQKEISKSFTKLKLLRKTLATTTYTFSSSEPQFCSITRTLVESSVVTISTFQSFLMFLHVPVSKPKSNRWSLVSKLVHKGILASEMQNKELSQLENVDIALNDLMLEGENVEFAQRNLENLDSNMEDIENGLEQLFRLLIQTRVSLLNILSQ